MKQFSFIVVLVFLFACQSRVNPIHSKKYAELEKTGWLLGVWQKQSGRGILTESWQLLNDSTFTGRSFFISNGDTLSSEKISLEKRNGKLYYLPIVADQNNGKAVVFTKTSLTDSTITFENPEHDFPQKIHYRLAKTDSLVAEVSAKVNGNQKLVTFRMKRIK